ncbi:hypothetical protein ACIGHB_30390 [Streptomyces sp. NPDC085460]|uniref:hypothetical protein n=1 Tax=Streptomyces sp. NPDC085460 TaxID=3365723 RepID=UPI0037CE8682
MTRQRVEMRHRQPTDTDEPEIRAPEARGEAPDPGPEEDGQRRKVDLSVPQVAGSAVAAVIAAKFASTLGVYGTILGAGVISVIATCGGPLFQLLFSRTGEQVRDATAAAKPKARQVPSPSPVSPVSPVPEARPAGDRHTLMLGTVPGAAAPFPYDEEFGAATTHGTRLRGWKRPMLAAALVFGVTMGGITAYELVSGEDFSGTKGTTTFGSVVRGGGDGGRQDAPEERKQQEQQQEQEQQERGQDEDRERGQEPPTPAPSGTPGGDTGEGAGTDPVAPPTGATPDPGDGTPSGDPTTGPTPDPTGSDGGGTPPTQEPVEPTAPTTGPTAPATPPAPTEDPGTGPARQGAPTAPSGATAG